MPANTSRGFPYVLPADHPLEYPAMSQQLAEAIEARGLLAANALKSGDQAGIASGGSAGITATLAGLRVGAKVLGLFNLMALVTAGGANGNLYVAHTGLTGASTIGTPYEYKTQYSLNVGAQVIGFYLFSATAASMSVGMSSVNSQGSVWTCRLGTSITLVSL